MKRPWYWLSAAIAISLASPAGAQKPPGDDAKDAARSLATTGRQRFEAGDYAGAVEALRDAAKYFQAPTIIRMLALSHEKLGHLVEARDLYKQAADEKLAPGAKPQLKKAQEEARKSLDAIEPRIPRVKITLTNAPPGTSVAVDGKPLAAAALAELQLNPGKHSITVEPPGATKITRDIDLKEQAVEKITIDVAKAAPKPVVTAGATAAASVSAGATAGSSSGAAPKPGPAEGRSVVGPAIVFSIGGAALIAGGIAGGLSFVKAGEVQKTCGPQLICPESYRDQVEAGKTFGYVSTIGFAVGGAGVLLGVILLLVPGKKSAPPNVGVSAGPGSLSVKGAF